MKGFVADIEELTEENRDFRRVLYTGKQIQLVLMSLLPGEEIGDEVHEDREYNVCVEATRTALSERPELQDFIRYATPKADRSSVGKTINTLGFGPAKVAAFPSSASAGGLEALRQLHAHLPKDIRRKSVRPTYVRVRPYAPCFDNRLSPAPAFPRNRRLSSRCPETPHRPLQGQGSLHA